MKLIKPSILKGKILAPPSKSITVRAAAAALLSFEETHLLQPSFCDDAQAAFRIIETLGAKVKHNQDENICVMARMAAREKIVLNCGESALAMRLFTPIAALLNIPIKLKARGTLQRRPMGFMEPALKQLNAWLQTANGKPPLWIKGPLQAGQAVVDGSLSSQFLSGLLMALPLVQGKSEIRVPVLKSSPYVRMTLDLLSAFNIEIQSDKELSHFIIPGNQSYKRKEYIIGKDWSGASFLLVAGALCGSVSVEGLDIYSPQPDKRILEALETAGAKVSISSNSITVENQSLNSFDFDASQCPDLIPPLAVLAAGCRGVSRLKGTDRLTHKESNRKQALLTELGKIGVDIKSEGHSLIIKGGPIKGGTVHSYHDHRLAMAEAVAGLSSKTGVKIKNWQAVSKSYPAFFHDLKSLGGNIR
ncbi:MAG: 3-phosphoshikimate 1-carboxyvinyltransferase [Candidatus Aminicenantales bacterium]